MDKIKINLDRTKLSSEYIQSKQDFAQITNQVPAKGSLFKSTWFYGGIGLASVAGMILLAFNFQKNDTNETKLTLAQNNLSPTITQISNSNSQSNDVVSKTTSFEPKSETISRNNLKKNKIAHARLFSEKEVERQGISVPSQSAEPEIIIIETNKVAVVKKNRLPNIRGVYSGELALEKLCANGIEVNEDIQISSFKIQYATARGDKFLTIQGDKIPANICKDINDLGIDQMIFLTDIIGKDPTGKMLSFTPMNFTCLIEE